MIAPATDQHDVGEMQWRLLFHDPAHLRHAPGTDVSFHDIDAFDHDTAGRGEHPRDGAPFPALSSRDDENGIALPDLGRYYSTSGARDTILIKFLSRSSRAMGPKTRVPLGAFWSVRSTAAFSSNLM